MNLHFILSEFEKSRAEGELLLALARQAGDRVKEGVALATMGRASHDSQQALTIGNPTQLWKTYLTIGRLHTEARRQEKADQTYNAAREVMNKIMKSLQDPELRMSLSSHPLIRQIFDLSAPE